MELRPTARRQNVAGLECVVVDPTAEPFTPRGLVVLCHGFGAPGTDLVDCCRAMWQLEPSRLAQVRFAFPAGPEEIAGDGHSDARAWWMIDVERLMASIESGDFRDLRSETPPELPVRRRELTDCIDELRDAAQLPWRSVFVGGFSQGAMLTTDVALLAPEPCGGLVVWSGTLLAESIWRDAAQRPAKFPVFQSHGRFDPILPFAAAVWLQNLLQESGFSVEFVPFNGLHEIPMPAMRGAAALIAKTLG